MPCDPLEAGSVTATLNNRTLWMYLFIKSDPSLKLWNPCSFSTIELAHRERLQQSRSCRVVPRSSDRSRTPNHNSGSGKSVGWILFAFSTLLFQRCWFEGCWCSTKAPGFHQCTPPYIEIDPLSVVMVMGQSPTTGAMISYLVPRSSHKPTRYRPAQMAPLDIWRALDPSVTDLCE